MAALQEQLAHGVVLDGKLVICVDGRLYFAALHGPPGWCTSIQRRAAGMFGVFDILALGGDELRGLAYARRRELVAELLAQAAPPLAVPPMTTDLAGARAWLTDHVEAGIEGVVVKNVTHAYRPARRSWLKIKTSDRGGSRGRVTGPLDALEVLILGRADEGAWLRWPAAPAASLLRCGLSLLRCWSRRGGFIRGR